MRSILALGMAALILAAHAPGLFTETPVCAAVDGANASFAKSRRFPGSMWHKRKPAESPSCCGSASCPMHAKGCGQMAACTMEAAYGPDAVIASKQQEPDTKLCAPSCGREGTKMAPGLPDPGTLDVPNRPLPVFAESRCRAMMPTRPSTPSLDPSVPPPRS